MILSLVKVCVNPIAVNAQVNSYNDRITVVENLIKAEIDAVDSKQQVSISPLCSLHLHRIAQSVTFSLVLGQQISPEGIGKGNV